MFDAGSEVYELIAPNGKVYVMQSYAQIVDDEADSQGLECIYRLVTRDGVAVEHLLRNLEIY